MDSFTHAVQKEIMHYVYRLIDPRNGETFYVGRGQGNRVFDHVKADLKLREEEGEDRHSVKLDTIQKIKDEKLEVLYIVHRHGLDEETAVEVEAALIDCFRGLTNLMAGTGSNERGPANVKQLRNRYEMPVMELDQHHRLLFIKTRQQTVDEVGLYEAVRGCWTLNRARAENAEYILAIVDQVCRGVFKACEWKPCEEPEEKRSRFDGHEVVDTAVVDRYVDKLIPADKRKPGMASPFLYENCSVVLSGSAVAALC